jgi:hypothetical protein
MLFCSMFQLMAGRARRNHNGCKMEVFTAVTMKNAVFWDVTPFRSCVNQRFGGTYRFHIQGRL